MKGLSKAERHEIKRCVRSCPLVTNLALAKMPRWFYRIMRAEIRKRRWEYVRSAELSVNPRWRPVYT